MTLCFTKIKYMGERRMLLKFKIMRIEGSIKALQTTMYECNDCFLATI